MSLYSSGCGIATSCVCGRSPGSPVRALRQGHDRRNWSGSQGLGANSRVETDSRLAGLGQQARPSTKSRHDAGSGSGPKPRSLPRGVAPRRYRFHRNRNRPGELGSASSAGRGAGMRPGSPSSEGSTASAKREFPAAPRPFPPVSARRLFPRPEHDPKAHVSTSRAAANAPTLDRGRSRAPPCREGGLRCRGGQFTHGNEPKRVSSARHP